MDPFLVSMAVALHVSAALIWTGGTFFTHFCLHPVVAEQLDLLQGRAFTLAVLQRFMRWMAAAAALVSITGIGLALRLHGGISIWPWYVSAMAVLGAAMIANYLQLAYALLPRLRTAFFGARDDDTRHWLDLTRRRLALNLVLGFAAVAIATAGRVLHSA